MDEKMEQKEKEEDTDVVFGFLAACHAGDAHQVSEMLALRPELANARNSYNEQSALHTACAAGHVEVVKALLLRPAVESFAADCLALSDTGGTPMDVVMCALRAVNGGIALRGARRYEKSAYPCCSGSYIPASDMKVKMRILWHLLASRGGFVCPLEKPESLVETTIVLDRDEKERNVVASVNKYDQRSDRYQVCLSGSGETKWLALYATPHGMRKMVTRFVILSAKRTAQSASLSDYVFGRTNAWLSWRGMTAGAIGLCLLWYTWKKRRKSPLF